MFKSIESKVVLVDISRNRFTNLLLALHNLTSLVSLYMNNNLATLGEENQFINLTQLMILHLADNNIRVINENVFSGLEKLMFLYLDKNYITNIKADVSLHTPLLASIILKDNLLSDTPNLGNLPILRKIDLSGNQIRVLKNTSFSTLVNIGDI